VSVREATTKLLRGRRGEAAGTELGSSFVERITVNVGTASVHARRRAPSTAGRAGFTVSRSVWGGTEPP